MTAKRNSADEAPPDHMPAARLRPALQMVRLVSRPHVLALLRAGAACRLTLIQAPAGYGKTTVMAQWRDALLAEGEAVAWLMLAPDDGEPGHFLAALSGALADAGIVKRGFTLPADLRTEPALGLLIRAVERAKRPGMIFLDDYHLVDDARIDPLLDVLLARLPPGVRIALATRRRPSIAYSKLRPAGLLNELGSRELRFSVGDAKALFGELLSDDDLAALNAHTEGWVVALQLARLWVADSAQPARQIRHFMGAAGDMAEYLAEQVLETLPDDAREFLIETAHLARVQGDLADAVRQRTDGWDNLRALEPLNALIVADGAADGWYRYHQLFAEYLRGQQRFLGEARVRSLNRRAAKWYSANGDLGSAVRHAIAAGEPGRAALLIEEAGGLRIGLQQGIGRLRALLSHLPLAAIYASPHLALARTYVLAKEARLDEARRHFEHARELAAEAGPNDTLFASNLMLTEMLLGIYEDAAFSDAEFAAMVRSAEQMPDSEQLDRGWLNNQLCIVAFRRGALDQARRAAERAMEYYVDAGTVYLQIFMRLHHGLIALEQGALEDARAWAESAVNEARDAFETDAGLIGLCCVAQAEIAYEQDRLDEVRALLFDALDDVEQYEGWMDIFARGYLTISALSLADDKPAATLSALERAEETASTRNLPGLAWLAQCRRVELLVLAGDVEGARALADRWRLSFGEADAPQGWRERMAAGLALARLASAEGKHKSCAKIIAALKHECTESGNLRVHLKAVLLEALDCARQDDLAGAVASLDEALPLGVGGGFRRSFIDEGPAMTELLRRAVRHRGASGYAPDEVRFMADILFAINGDAGLLSPREREILTELAKGQTNKMIARALEMSEPTVKFHLKNVYGKLGVNNRALAVALAEQCALIDT